MRIVSDMNLTPHYLEPIVVAALRRYEEALAAGALIVVDEARLRVRVLPLQR
jgi:hypothetical protein